MKKAFAVVSLDKNDKEKYYRIFIENISHLDPKLSAQHWLRKHANLIEENRFFVKQIILSAETDVEKNEP